MVIIIIILVAKQLDLILWLSHGTRFHHCENDVPIFSFQKTTGTHLRMKSTYILYHIILHYIKSRPQYYLILKTVQLGSNVHFWVPLRLLQYVLAWCWCAPIGLTRPTRGSSIIIFFSHYWGESADPCFCDDCRGDPNSARLHIWTSITIEDIFQNLHPVFYATRRQCDDRNLYVVLNLFDGKTLYTKPPTGRLVWISPYRGRMSIVTHTA